MDDRNRQPGARDAPTITLVSGDLEEEQAGWQLLRLIERYDLRRWQFTDAVQIDQTAIPHSRPVLTLNTRYLGDDDRALATYLHEQQHWFAISRGAALHRAMQELRRRFPSVPAFEAGGARDENSTYLHLVVCPLEYAALSEVIGADAARAPLERADFYTWIYATILCEWDYFADLLSRHGLVPGAGPAAPASSPATSSAARLEPAVAIPWRIRPVERVDAAAWEGMREQLWPAPPGEHAAEIGRFFDGTQALVAAVLVAEDEAGRLIGFAELSIRSHADGCESNGVGYLEGWFVEAAQRQKGAGTALVRAAEQWAREQGCTEFASDVEIENDVSLAAHRSLGFEEISRVVTFKRHL